MWQGGISCDIVEKDIKTQIKQTNRRGYVYRKKATKKKKKKKAKKQEVTKVVSLYKNDRKIDQVYPFILGLFIIPPTYEVCGCI